MNTELLYAVFPPEIYFLHDELATSSGFTRSTNSAGSKRALQTGQQICIFRLKSFAKKCSHEQLGPRMCPQGSLHGFSSRLPSVLVERHSSMHILHSLSSLARSITDVKGWRTFAAYAVAKSLLRGD
jgi:hypothetical protein